MNEQKLVIWGCGGMGREINFLCEELGHEVIGFLDERPEIRGETVDGVAVLGDIKDIVDMRDKVKVICSGVGDPALKNRLVKKTLEHGFIFAETLVHPSVYISRRNHIGIGSIICAGAKLTINVRIGNFVIVNTNTTLAHDVKIDDYVTISPGVNVSGNVTIGKGTFIGTGSAIREKITIGEWSLIGGGAFVKDDVSDKVMYAGVPAKFKKRL